MRDQMKKKRKDEAIIIAYFGKYIPIFCVHTLLTILYTQWIKYIYMTTYL